MQKRKIKAVETHRHLTRYFVAFQKYVKDLRPIKGSRSLAIGTCPSHNKKASREKHNENPLFVVNYKTGQWICFESGNCGEHEVFRDLCSKGGNRRNITRTYFHLKSDTPEQIRDAIGNDFDIDKW